MRNYTKLSMMIREQDFATDRQFAQAVGISPEIFSLINQKQVLPTVADMRCICAELDIEPTEYWSRKELVFEGLQKKTVKVSSGQKRERLNLEMTGLLDRVQKAASAEGMTPAEWIRDLIRKALPEERELQLMKMA